MNASNENPHDPNLQRDPTEFMMPRILVVDDERQIHASLRLRLSADYDMSFSTNARDALETIASNRFDLCFVDIHMPKMDGIAFIDEARKLDADLGYVIISAFDNDHNLRRSIPRQVYEFLSKPLPERDGFEGRIRGWIERTQQKRRETQLAKRAGSVVVDLDIASLEREIELLASENTRAALRQISTLLTNIHAHLVAGTASLGHNPRASNAPVQLQRNLDEARRGAETAIAVSEAFFASSYGSRDASDAVANESIRDAINIAARIGRAEESNKIIDFDPLDVRLSIQGITGINFLIMLVPTLGVALQLAASNTTVRVRAEHHTRFDVLAKNPHLRSHLWINRRNISGSNPCLAVSVSVNAPPLARAQIEAWLKNEYEPLSMVASRRLIAGVLQSRGMLGFSLPPSSTQFSMVLALPT